MIEPRRSEQDSQGETREALGRGWVVFVLLAVLTAVEFVVAVAIDANIPILAVIAIAKAVLIAHYFMHIARAWRGEGEA